jgi:multiple sugar transport system substrate-binding protein
MNCKEDRMGTLVLRGMTWSEPRGYAPLVACADLWRAKTGVAVSWERRSLQDFETFPVEELAKDYDLLVIDHPHVGQAAREGCLAPFDQPLRASERAELERASVGPSWSSYRWEGQQWALPIDAAAQVMAWSPDRLAEPPATWRDVLHLARQGAAICPMRPPHALMALFTLVANLGAPAAVDGPELLDAAAGAEAFGRLRELAVSTDPRGFTMDPIQALEAMSAADSPYAVAPLIYGYVNYAAKGYRPRRIRFADIAPIGAIGPAGSALGGAGLAVSAMRGRRAEAAAFAYWVASGEAQAGLYATSGGQPAHARAWDSDDANRPVGDFYRATRRTLDAAWVRPRRDGYMPFQDSAARLLNQALQTGSPAGGTIRRIKALFHESLESGGAK